MAGRSTRANFHGVSFVGCWSKNDSMSATTSRECVELASRMHSTTPVTRSRGLMALATIPTVSSSLPYLLQREKCACIGMITSRAAARPLSVSRPSDCGAVEDDKVVAGIIRDAFRRYNARSSRAAGSGKSRLISAAARSVWLGSSGRLGDILRTARAGSAAGSINASYTENSTELGVDPQVERGVGLRVEIDNHVRLAGPEAVRPRRG